MIPFLDLAAQYAPLREEIHAAVRNALDERQFILGRYVEEFEAAFAKCCGVKHAVAVNSGTSALHLALLAAGVNEGDEVITVPYTFIATVAAVVYCRARPVLVDIEPCTFNMDVAQVERAITPKTKAILPVHLYGQPADMDPILAIARKHGLRVIGDAAQAHGSLYRGRPIATLADVTCYSFYPGKNLGAYGDAGALVTNDEQVAAAARMVANHGRTKKYDHDFEGVNSRLDGVQAAVLNVKLRYIEKWTEQRRQAAAWYNEALLGSGVSTPVELDDVRAVYHLYIVRVPNGRREALQEFLKNEGISTGIHYPIALPYLNAYKHLGHTEADFPEALAASTEIVSLPMYPEITREQVQYVAAKIREYVRS